MTPESGYKAAKKLFGLKNRPTAIFASNDLMAFGAIYAAKEMGLKVPDDVAVLGFDNIPLSSYFEPTLTTVEIPMYDLGIASMQMLVNLICGNDFDRFKLFKTKLLVRASTRSN
jgi:LacI family repressor for deo operon, udp, cdd, tsx, nupC, and nupG